jgi:hypothetical protein
LATPTNIQQKQKPLKAQLPEARDLLMIKERISCKFGVDDKMRRRQIEAIEFPENTILFIWKTGKGEIVSFL